MKKEGKKFREIYQGQDTTYKIIDLKVNANYELRICTVYGDLISPWVKIDKFKTLDYDYNCDSEILSESKRKNEFVKEIYDWCGNRKMELLYGATRDGANASNFHQICNNKGPTLTLFKSDKNNIFGGYTSKSWTSRNGYCSDNDCFLFTLKNTQGTRPNKFRIKDINYSIYDYYNYGPTFGNGYDINIQNNFFNNNHNFL